MLWAGRGKAAAGSRGGDDILSLTHLCVLAMMMTKKIKRRWLMIGRQAQRFLAQRLHVVD